MIYKEQMIFNEPIHANFNEELDSFDNIEVNERIVEISFVFKELKLEQGIILDAGCCESKIVIELASLGYKVYGLDLGKYYFKHKNFTFVNEDITVNSFPNDLFDRIIAVSSLEHIGLGRYDKTQTNGDLIALKELARVLKKMGKLIITLPFGKPIDTDWYRVYNVKRLMSMFKEADLIIEKMDIFFRENQEWVPCSAKIGEAIDSHSNKVNAVACIVANKKNFRRSIQKIWDNIKK